METKKEKKIKSRQIGIEIFIVCLYSLLIMVLATAIIGLSGLLKGMSIGEFFIFGYIIFFGATIIIVLGKIYRWVKYGF